MRTEYSKLRYSVSNHFLVIDSEIAIDYNSGLMMSQRQHMEESKQTRYLDERRMGNWLRLHARAHHPLRHVEATRRNDCVIV